MAEDLNSESVLRKDGTFRAYVAYSVAIFVGTEFEGRIRTAATYVLTKQHILVQDIEDFTQIVLKDIKYANLEVRALGRPPSGDDRRSVALRDLYRVIRPSNHSTDGVVTQAIKDLKFWQQQQRYAR